jgi:hypothetical protein
MADLLAAAASRERAITGASHDDGAHAWGRWQQWCWCESVGCNETYLDGFNQVEQNLLLGAFSMAVREGRFSRDHSEQLVEGTVRGTISHVVQAFRESGRQNPTKNTDNMLSVYLSRQSRAYRNDNTKEVQQKALPFINPTKNTDNMLSVYLSRQFRAYRTDTTKEVQQKALHFIVLDELAKRQFSERDRAIVQLTISAASLPAVPVST